MLPPFSKASLVGSFPHRTRDRDRCKYHRVRHDAPPQRLCILPPSTDAHANHRCVYRGTLLIRFRLQSTNVSCHTPSDPLTEMTFIHRNRSRSHLGIVALPSSLQPTSHFAPLTSHLSTLTSHLAPRTSHLAPRTSLLSLLKEGVGALLGPARGGGVEQGVNRGRNKPGSLLSQQDPTFLLLHLFVVRKSPYGPCS